MLLSWVVEGTSSILTVEEVKTTVWVIFKAHTVFHSITNWWRRRMKGIAI